MFERILMVAAAVVTIAEFIFVVWKEVKANLQSDDAEKRK